MTSQLLALILGLALVAAEGGASGGARQEAQGYRNKYRNGREYVYRYEAQLSTGAPHNSKLWSGLRMTANLHLQFHRGNYVMCMFKDVTLYQMDQFVEERTPSFFMMPEERLRESVNPDTQQMAQKIQEPFWIRYDNGNVQKVLLPNTEPLWSANIKRGAVSVMEVNLQQTYSVFPVSNTGSIIDPVRSNGWTVFEPTPLGYCKTFYSPRPTGVSEVMYISKVRDYSLCFHRQPRMDVFNNFHPQQNDVPNTPKTLSMTGEFTYTITGNKRAFVVLTAVGESKISFRPYGQQAGVIQTSVNQTMTLLKSFRMKTKPALPDEKMFTERHTSLRMTLPQNNEQLGEENLYKLHDIEVEKNEELIAIWSEDKMMKLLELVAEDTEQGPSMDGLMTMQSLMEMLQTSSPNKLKKLWDQVKKSQNADLKKKILVHLMSVAGTTPTAHLVLNECKTNPQKIPASCIAAITMIGTFAPPSQHTIDKLFVMANLAFQGKVFSPENRFQVAEACYLAAGAVMGRAEDLFSQLSAKGKDEMVAHYQVMRNEKSGMSRSNLMKSKKNLRTAVRKMVNGHVDLESKFLQKLSFIKGLRNVPDTEKNADLKQAARDPEAEPMPSYWWRMMVELRTIRNAHIPRAFRYLKSVIEDPHYPEIIRIAAIQALDKFQTDKSFVVMEMEKILKNPGERSAVRIQAFRTMLNVQAPVHALVRIAGSLRYEPDRQVSCYVWSVFDKLGNSTFAPYRHLAANLTLARPHLSPLSCGVQDSSYYHVTYGSRSGPALLSETSYLSTRDFHVQADTSLSLDLFGLHSKFFQMSWQSQGVEQVMKRLFGEDGFLTRRKSVFDLLKRSPRSTPSDLIGKIWDTLKITARKIPIPQAFLSMKLFNNDIKVLELTNILRSLMRGQIETKLDQNRWSAGLPINYQTAGFAGHFHSTLPTEAGIPVMFNIGLAYSVNMAGQAKFEVKPPLFEKDNIGEPKDVSAGVSINPKMVVSLMGKMSVGCSALQAGAAFNAIVDINSPISVNVNANTKNSAVKIFISPPTQVEPVLKVKVQPFFYSSVIPSTPQAPAILTTRQPIIHNYGASIKQSCWSHGQDWLGYNVTMLGEHAWGTVPKSLTPPLMSNAYFALYCSPGSLQPPGVTVAFKYLSTPRYTKGKEVCDSWWPFWCRDTSDSGEPASPPSDNSEPPAPLPAFPDIYRQQISFAQLKQHLTDKLGLPIMSLPTPSEFGLMMMLDSSVPNTVRRVNVEAAFKAFKDGQFHQGAVLISRTPLPNNPDPWQMMLTTEAIFPLRKITVQDLVSPKYQIKVQHNLKSLLKMRSHQVSNRYLKTTMATFSSDLAMRFLPSLEPKIVIDRVVPEFLLQDLPYLRDIKHIMKDVLPNVKQIGELRSEMRDAVKIIKQQDLIFQMALRMIKSQQQVLHVLKQMGKQPEGLHGVVASVEFCILKISQGVFDLHEIWQRASSLNVFSRKDITNTFNSIMENQQSISTMALTVLPHLNIVDPTETTQVKDKPVPVPYSPPSVSEYGWSSSENPDVYGESRDFIPSEENPRPSRPTNIHQLQVELKKLTTLQLKVIHELQTALTKRNRMPVEKLPDLLESTTSSLIQIDQVLKMEEIADRGVKERLIQASIQNHLISIIIRKAFYGTTDEIVGSEEKSQLKIRTHSFKIKTLTKQLTERMAVILWQQQENINLVPTLDSSEEMMLKQLHGVERSLVTLKTHLMEKPSKNPQDPIRVHPWKNTIDIMNEQLSVLTSIRYNLIHSSSHPSPCLVNKLIATIFCLQQKVGVFRTSRLVQSSPARFEIIQDCEKLDDRCMALRQSLDQLFSKFTSGGDSKKGEIIMPAISIPISEGFLEMEEIRREMETLKHKMESHLFHVPRQNSDTIERVLRYVCDKMQELVRKMHEEQPRVKLAMAGTSVHWQYSLYSQFYLALTELLDLATTVQQQIQQHSNGIQNPSDIMEQITSCMQDLEALIQTQTSIAAPDDIVTDLPSENNPEYMDASADHSSYYSSVESPGIQPQHQRDSLRALYDISPSFSKGRHALKDKMLNQRLFGPRGIYFLVNATYGNLRAVPSNIKLHVAATKSVEQLLWEAAQANPVTRDAIVDYSIYSRLVDRERLHDKHKELLWRLNSYNHVHAQLTNTPDNIPRAVYGSAMSLIDYLRHCFYQTSARSPPMPFTSRRDIQIMMDFEPTMHAMDAFFMMERETTAIESIPLPPVTRVLYPFHNTVPLPYHLAKKLSFKYMPGTCSVYKKNVRTNDGAIYRLYSSSKSEVPPCEMLLAADCSSDKTFAITTKPSGDYFASQAIKIMAHGKVVELIPDSVTERVSVDGEEKALTMGGQPLVLTRNDDARKAATFIISRRPDHIRVELPLVGLDIAFSNMHCRIDMSIVYRNQLCGLCGNYDGQRTLELEGPQMGQHNYSESFVDSYIIKDTCVKPDTPSTS